MLPPQRFRNARRPRARLALLGAILILSHVSHAASIDRHAVVTRHNVRLKVLDPESPLSIGNGDFAFTADVTGFQTFESLYHQKGIPLETLSTWAWHSFPNTAGHRLEDTLRPSDFHGRTIQFTSDQHSAAGAYFRENPHPWSLGQITLLLDGHEVEPGDITGIDQTLDLWTGTLISRYRLGNQPVTVESSAHASRSAAAFTVTSPLIPSGALQIRIRFPYAHQARVKNKPPLIWDQPGRHTTRLVKEGPGLRQLERSADESRMFVTVRWENAATWSEIAPHEYRLGGAGTTGGDTLAFACEWSADAPRSLLSPSDIRESGIAGWRDYWTRGGIIDLADSTDARAREIERRVILSLYLVKVNYAGSFPPSEGGLTVPTWYGKHNSEMFFWHAAHFYQWGRVELLEKGLAWYLRILSRAKEDAASNGFAGARWPKMSGPEGEPAPGSINPFIIWNHPNPIYLSELVYRARPTRETLETYRHLVFESAAFLASFAHFDEATGRYVLGPPIKNVSESTGANLTQNPTFELAYWHFALHLAQEWRKRLGLEPEPRWNDILARLARLPEIDGKYLEIETFPKMYEDPDDTPTSMLLALGMLPKTPWVDEETMRRTFHTLNESDTDSLGRWVSWAQGKAAMTAARLGEPDTAVAIVANQAPAARFMPNGHVRRPKEPGGCPAYLPVNASVLCAVGLMAAGWDGAPTRNAPGFPDDGAWVVHAEGLLPMP